MIGILLTKILFYKLPVLSKIKEDHFHYPSVSVIIPARNEENNLSLLLKDLNKQTVRVDEIICIDDDSSDSTADVAKKYGARVIRLKDKPEGWIGKSWACQNGADAAVGELLLFLDADVRLGKDGIRSILHRYQEEGCTISIQPYHKTQKTYEQFSLFFNLIQIAGNGIALPKPLKLGLYGPIILISRQDYIEIGQHKSVKSSIVDDISLGKQLKSKGLRYKVFIGNQDVYFRMYGNGCKDLLQGWTKNVTTGASQIPIVLFFMVFLWITSICSTPLQLMVSVVSVCWKWIALYSTVYVIWVGILAILGKRIGHFKAWAFMIFPICICFFIMVFAISAFKKIFGIKVTWKGRDVKTGDML